MAAVKTPLNPMKSTQKSEELSSSPMKVDSAQRADNTQAKTKSKVIIHYDVGFNNSISIRGKGAGLSWDKGIMLRNEGPDRWVWETNSPFQTCEFKVLINDAQYEQGENHTLSFDKCLEYTPIFV